MDDFETFKASREKMDPASRKFTERQWRKAYAAYRRSRKRVGEGTQEQTGESSKRRRSSNKGSSQTSPSRRERRSHAQGGPYPTLHLREEVRQNSAYGDLRTIVDVLAWVTIGLVVLGAGVKLAYYTDGAIALGAVLNAAAKVVGIAVLRLLAHAIVDIPDIAIQKKLFKQKGARGQTADHD
jgi:hypothetical protein